MPRGTGIAGQGSPQGREGVHAIKEAQHKTVSLQTHGGSRSRYILGPAQHPAYAIHVHVLLSTYECQSGCPALRTSGTSAAWDHPGMLALMLARTVQDVSIAHNAAVFRRLPASRRSYQTCNLHAPACVRSNVLAARFEHDMPNVRMCKTLLATCKPSCVTTPSVYSIFDSGCC